MSRWAFRPPKKNAVDQLIDDYICEADLAAEMDGDGVATS